MQKRFQEEGMNVYLNASPVEVSKRGDEKVVYLEMKDGSKKEIVCDEILVAVGRKANVKGFGLEELGVQISKRGTIEIDDYCRTNISNIYACGDVAGPYQFTHFAAHQAWYCAVNSLFSPFRPLPRRGHWCNELLQKMEFRDPDTNA